MTIACADESVEWAALFEPPTLDDEYLVPLLACLCQLNLIWLRRHSAPPLYAAGIVYQSEPAGQEHWRAIPHVLRLGYADCKSLAAWRVAELRMKGVAAACRHSWRDTERGRLWHITVQFPTGRIEDPSRILGMGTIT